MSRLNVGSCSLHLLTCARVLQAEFGEDALKQLRMRKAAERRAAAEAQMDSNLIPLGQRVVRFMSSSAGQLLLYPNPPSIGARVAGEQQMCNMCSTRMPLYAEAGSIAGGGHYPHACSETSWLLHGV